MEDVKDLIVFSQTLVRPLWEEERKKNSSRSAILSALEHKLTLYQSESLLRMLQERRGGGEKGGRGMGKEIQEEDVARGRKGG
eukprot:319905-Hanusia_phi.AAC.1